MPITNAAERRVGEKNTLAFIEADPVHQKPGTILRRPKTTKTAAGGVKRVEPDLLPPQLVRIVPMSGLVWDRSRTTPDEGRIQDVTEQLIGMPSLDVKPNDFFPAPDNVSELDTGGWYVVTHVSPVKGYRRESRLRYTSSKPSSA